MFVNIFIYISYDKGGLNFPTPTPMSTVLSAPAGYLLVRASAYPVKCTPDSSARSCLPHVLYYIMLIVLISPSLYIDTSEYWIIYTSITIIGSSVLMYERIQFFRDRRKVKKHTQHYISIFLYFVPDLQRRVFITTVHFFLFLNIFLRNILSFIQYTFISRLQSILYILPKHIILIYKL